MSFRTFFLMPILLAILAGCSSQKENVLYVQTRGGAEPGNSDQCCASGGCSSNTAVEVKKGEAVAGISGGRTGQWLKVVFKDLEGWIFDKTGRGPGDRAQHPVLRKRPVPPAQFL